MSGLSRTVLAASVTLTLAGPLLLASGDGSLVADLVQEVPPNAVGMLSSVDVDDDQDLVVIGEIAANGGIGSAHVYRRIGSTLAFEQTLTPSQGFSGDEFGHAVAVSGSRILVGMPRALISGVRRGAAYVFEHDGAVWNEVTRLTAGDGSLGDRFGGSVDLDGDVLVVAAADHDDPLVDSGAVYPYRFDGTTWQPDPKIARADGGTGDLFGQSVALLGLRLAVGAPLRNGAAVDTGTALIYDFDGSAWTEQDEVMAWDTNSDIYFGASVFLHGNRLAVGAPQDLISGSAYVFEDTGLAWNPEQKLGTVLFDFDKVGTNVVLDDTRLITGRRLYRHDGVQWSESERLMFPPESTRGGGVARGGRTVAVAGTMALALMDPVLAVYRDAVNPCRYSPPTDSEVGSEVSHDGNAVVIGRPADDQAGADAGSAAILRRSGDTWSLEQTLLPADLATDDNFGGDVAMSGNSVIVGAWQKGDVEPLGGAAYAYRFDGSVWQETRLPTAVQFFGLLGYRVAASGDSVAASAIGDGVGGVVYVYDWNGAGWDESQIASVVPSDQLGTELALDGDRVVAVSQSHVFVYDRAGGPWTEELSIPIASGTRSVAIHGDVLAVGAVALAGTVDVYRHDGLAWQCEQQLVLSENTQRGLGSSVDLYDDLLLAGASAGNVRTTFEGAGHLYRYDGSSWRHELRLIREPSLTSAGLGTEVSLGSGRDAWLVSNPVVEESVYFPLAMGLDANPETVATGDALTFTVCSGAPLQPVFLLVADISGVPFVLAVAKGQFDGFGRFELNVQVPPGLSGLTATMLGLGVSMRGVHELTNTECLQFE